MSPWSWLKPCKRAPKAPTDISEFEITAEDLAKASAVPMETEIKAVRLDYLHTIIALGRANANAQRILAEQTLINVQGKMRHGPQVH